MPVKNWSQGEIITQEKLNSIEEIVQEVKNARLNDNSLTEHIENMIQVSNDTPSGDNKIWLNVEGGSEEISVSTYDEFCDLKGISNKYYTDFGNTLWADRTNKQTVKKLQSNVIQTMGTQGGSDRVWNLNSEIYQSATHNELNTLSQNALTYLIPGKKYKIIAILESGTPISSSSFDFDDNRTAICLFPIGATVTNVNTRIASIPLNAIQDQASATFIVPEEGCWLGLRMQSHDNIYIDVTYRIIIEEVTGTIVEEVENVNALAGQAKAKADQFDVTQKRGFTYDAYGDDFTGRWIANNNDVTVTKTGPMVVFNGVQQTSGVGFAISGDTFASMASTAAAKTKKVGYTTDKLTLKAGRTYLTKVHFISGSFINTAPETKVKAYFRLALDTLDSSIAEPVDNDVVDNFIMDVTRDNGEVLYATDMVDAAQIIQPVTDVKCGFVVYWRGNIDVNNFTFIVEIKETAAPYNVIRPHKGVYSTNHRGWYQCPEETLTAYRQSAAHGFTQVEADVRFTSDKVPVLLHDATINNTARNADGTEIADDIYIASITYEQARTYDFGIYKGAQFAGEKIPTLEELLELCRNIGIIPYIELEGNPTNETVASFVNVVNKSAIRNDIVFISNSVNWLSRLIQYFPSNRFGVTPFNYSDAYRVAAIAMFNNRAEIFMNMGRTQVTSEIIETLKASNIPLEIWVAEEDDIKNADGYITGFSSNRTLASHVLYHNEIPSIPFYLPVRWRMGHLAETGAFSPHMKGVTSDFLIPTAICDRVIRLGAKSIYIGYYRVSNGKTVFDNRAQVPSNATQYIIDKAYPYFAVSVFDNWNVMALEDGDNNVALQYLPASNDAIKNPYLYSLTNNQNKKPSDTIWSICHQGYNNGQLGHNLPGGYAEAASRGFTHAECDTRLTSDNEVVCCHDTSFVDDNSGDTIVIANHTLAELKTYSYYGGTIATLGEIITECRSVGLGLFIDQITTATEYYVYDVVKRYNAINMCYFMSTDISALSSIINRDPAANIGFVSYIVSTNHSTVIQQLQALNHDVIYDLGSYDGNRTPAEVAAIAALLPGNMRLMLWTIDNTKWINDVLPYICGWTSNGVSGRDIFNPETVVGLDFLKQS